MAVVGRNGIGKSTLFKLVLGELESSRGSVDFPDDWRVGHMAQEVHAIERPALEYVIDGDRELRQVEADIGQTEDAEKLANLYSRYEDLGGYQATEAWWVGGRVQYNQNGVPDYAVSATNLDFENTGVMIGSRYRFPMGQKDGGLTVGVSYSKFFLSLIHI